MRRETSVLTRFSRHWKQRHHYRTLRSWVLVTADHLARRSPLPLPGRGCVRLLKLRNVRNPICFRLGSTDLLVIKEIFFNGEYNHVLSAQIAPPRLILDLGANAGYSVRFWKENYPFCRVVAVEPDAGNARLCRLNAAIAGCSADVTLIEACAGGRNRQAALLRHGGEWSYSMVDHLGPEPTGIPVLTIPQILQIARETGSIDLLKCDIEGAERELFAQANGWLRRVRNLIVELHPGYQAKELLEDIERTGARFETVSSAKGNTLLFLHQRQ